MSESPTKDHNVKARKGIIRDACRRIASLEEQRKAISQDIASIKQTHVKGDLGMKISDFNLAYRLYKLEGDDRNTCLDTLAECFDALEVGAQLNFLNAVGAEKAVAPATAEKPKGRGRRKNPTPEQLGETANKPHEPIDNMDDQAHAAAEEHEDVDNGEIENDETSERDDDVGNIPESLDRRGEVQQVDEDEKLPV